MLRPCVARAIVVDVPEIPRLPGADQPAAPGARYVTRPDTGLPHPPETLVVRAVTPRNSLLRRHQSSTLKTGRESDCAGS
jgi:hypothetical protein